MFALFFISGFCGLLYQVCWNRILGLIFGTTAYATGTVLAVFMGGLSLGAYYFGRIADRMRNKDLPLKWYGIIQIVVGVYSIITPAIFFNLHHVFVPVASLFGQMKAFSILTRFLFSVIILILPTFLMGGTFPLVVKYWNNYSDKLKRGVGGLYGINTAGGVAGTLLTGFILIPALGVTMSILLAVCLNLTIGVSAFLSGGLPKKVFGKNIFSVKEEGTEKVPVISSGDQSPAYKLVYQILFMAAFITGIVSFMYEVSWTRVLVQVIGSSTYAFTLMLSIFLLGI